MTMMRMTGRALLAGFAMLALLAGTTPLSAEQAGGQGQWAVAAADRTDQVEKAEQLEARARGLMHDRSGWRDAAGLLRRAAELRPEGDAQAVSNLVTGSRLAYYTGDSRSALGDLRRAGDRALQMGDVNAAAHAYLDAAWMGVQLSRAEVVEEYMRKADLLALSPQLAESEREAIQLRIDMPT